MPTNDPGALMVSGFLLASSAAIALYCWRHPIRPRRSYLEALARVTRKGQPWR